METVAGSAAETPASPASPQQYTPPGSRAVLIPHHSSNPYAEKRARRQADRQNRLLWLSGAVLRDPAPNGLPGSPLGTSSALSSAKLDRQAAAARAIGRPLSSLSESLPVLEESATPSSPRSSHARSATDPPPASTDLPSRLEPPPPSPHKGSLSPSRDPSAAHGRALEGSEQGFLPGARTLAFCIGHMGNLLLQAIGSNSLKGSNAQEPATANSSAAVSPLPGYKESEGSDMFGSLPGYNESESGNFGSSSVTSGKSLERSLAERSRAERLRREHSKEVNSKNSSCLLLGGKYSTQDMTHSQSSTPQPLVPQLDIKWKRLEDETDTADFVMHRLVSVHKEVGTLKNPEDGLEARDPLSRHPPPDESVSVPPREPVESSSPPRTRSPSRLSFTGLQVAATVAAAPQDPPRTRALPRMDTFGRTEEVLIHTSAEEVLAWLVDFYSSDRAEQFKSQNKTMRVEGGGHHYALNGLAGFDSANSRGVLSRLSPSARLLSPHQLFVPPEDAHFMRSHMRPCLPSLMRGRSGAGASLVTGDEKQEAAAAEPATLGNLHHSDTQKRRGFYSYEMLSTSHRQKADADSKSPTDSETEDPTLTSVQHSPERISSKAAENSGWGDTRSSDFVTFIDVNSWESDAMGKEFVFAFAPAESGGIGPNIVEREPVAIVTTLNSGGRFSSSARSILDSAVRESSEKKIKRGSKQEKGSFLSLQRLARLSGIFDSGRISARLGFSMSSTRLSNASAVAPVDPDGKDNNEMDKNDDGEEEEDNEDEDDEDNNSDRKIEARGVDKVLRGLRATMSTAKKLSSDDNGRWQLIERRGSRAGIVLIRKLSETLCVVRMVVGVGLPETSEGSSRNLVNKIITIVKDLASVFHRNSRQVDDEYISSLARTMISSGDYLSSDHSYVLQQGLKLKQINAKKAFVTGATMKNFLDVATTTSRNSHLQVKSHIERGTKEVSLITKVDYSVDVPPEKALAFYWHFSGMTKMEHSQEEKNALYFNFRNRSAFRQPGRETEVDNERVLVTILRPDSFLRVRVLAIRIIWLNKGNGSFVLSWVPYTDSFDLLPSPSPTVVYLNYTGSITFDRVENNNELVGCQITSISKVCVPHRRSNCPSFLSSTSQLLKSGTFSNLLEVGFKEALKKLVFDSEVDREDRAELVRLMQQNQSYSTDEIKQFDEVERMTKTFTNATFQTLSTSNFLVPLSAGYVKMGKLLGEACAFESKIIVDGYFEDVAAWDWICEGRLRKKTFYEKERGVFLYSKRVNDHLKILNAVRYVLPATLRLLKHKVLWRRSGEAGSDESIEIVYVPNPSKAEMDIFDTYQIASVMTKVVFKKLPPIGDIPQTEVLYRTRIDSGLTLPLNLVQTSAARSVYTHLTSMQKAFERNREVDLVTRRRIVNTINDGGLSEEHINPRTLEFRDRTLELLDIFERVRPRDIDPLHVDDFESHVCFASSILPKTKDILWIDYTAVINGDAKSVAAFFWDTKSRSNMTAGSKFKECSRDSRSGTDGFRTQLTTIVIDCPVPYVPRLVENYCVFSQDQASFLISKLPRISQKSEGVVADKVGLDITSILRIFPGADPGTSRVHYVAGISLNGTNAQFIKKRIVPPLVYSLNHCQHCFSRMRPLSALDPHDGDVLANDMLLKLSTKQLKQTKYDDGTVRSVVHQIVEKVIAEYDGLTEVAAKYYWFAGFLEIILENKFSTPKSDHVSLQLASTGDAKNVAMSFSSFLAACTSSETAVDDWIANYELLREFSFENPWFKPLMRSVGAHLLQTATWGTTVRILSGASVALLESVFRILLIISYLRDESESRARSRAFAIANMVVVGVSVLLQLFIVVAVHGETTRSYMFQQLALVISFFKPVDDAVRVARGRLSEPGSKLDPVGEMILFKAVKLVVESVPCSVFMMIAFLGDNDLKSLGSGIVSVLCIAFTSVSMTFDKDTSPGARAHSPTVYGVFPDGKRVYSFCYLLIFTFCWGLLKTMSISLIYFLSPFGLVLFFVSSLALFLACKVAIGELLYWIPIQPSLFHIIFSLFQRSVCFLLVEICAFFQARHSLEYGARLLFAHIFFSYISVVVSVVFYAQYRHSAQITAAVFEDEEGIRNLYLVLGSLSVVALGSFVAFLWAIPSEKLKGLLLTSPSSAAFVDSVWENPNIATKLSIFDYSPHIYAELIPKVKEYFEVYFSALVENGHITPRVLSLIPPSTLPSYFDESLSKRIKESEGMGSNSTRKGIVSQPTAESLRRREGNRSNVTRRVTQKEEAPPFPPMSKFQVSVDVKGDAPKQQMRRRSISVFE